MPEFDKEAYWKRRNAEKERIAKGLPPHRKPRPRTYTPHEIQSMQYHKRVMNAVKNGDLTEQQARDELANAAKEATDNLARIKAPQELIMRVEVLILYGSYEAAQERARNLGVTPEKESKNEHS